jgi:biotin carboxyl carrier protein
MSTRDGAPREARLRATVDGESLDVRVAANEISAGPSDDPIDLRVTPVGGGPPLHLIVEGAVPSPESVVAPSTRARVATVDGVTWVFIDGDVFVIEVDDARQETTRRRDRSHQDALAAPMPATVTKILVEVGATVAPGDPLVLLEAMKMEMPIKAPHAGRVTAIHCRAGELVQPGVVLLEISHE